MNNATKKELEAAMRKAKSLPQGFIIGKILDFSKPIFSHNYAYYEIVATTEYTVTLEWKEAWSEGLVDERFATGGTFEKRQLKHIVDMLDVVNKTVGEEVWGKRFR
jgi:hypothetical protein